MKNFYIIKNKYPVIEERDKKYEIKAIKADFNWPLFLPLLVLGILGGFGVFVFFFWAIINRLWLVAFIGSIMYLVLYFLLGFLSLGFLLYLNPKYPLELLLNPFGEISMFTEIGIGLTLSPFSVIVGYQANEWRVNGLEKKGYDVLGMIKAPSKKAAIDLYLAEQQSDK